MYNHRRHCEGLQKELISGPGDFQITPRLFTKLWLCLSMQAVGDQIHRLREIQNFRGRNEV